MSLFSGVFCSFVFVYLCYPPFALRLSQNPCASASPYHDQGRPRTSQSITTAPTSWIGIQMSTNRNTRTGRWGDQIPLMPCQITGFIEQEDQIAQLAAQVSAQLAANPGRRVGPFRENSLAAAWYRNHPGDRDDDTGSSNVVRDEIVLCLSCTNAEQP